MELRKVELEEDTGCAFIVFINEHGKNHRVSVPRGRVDRLEKLNLPSETYSLVIDHWKKPHIQDFLKKDQEEKIALEKKLKEKKQSAEDELKEQEKLAAAAKKKEQDDIAREKAELAQMTADIVLKALKDQGKV